MADRKISDLTALTAPASGDYLPIVDISEAAAASKNKRITIEELFRGVPSGTAAAPSIAIEGDEDTGVYSPGANQLAISTAGSGRLFVDASGRVGIGASSPANGRLNVSSTTNQIALDTTDTATYGRLDIGHFTNGTFIGTYAGSNTASDLIRFGTGGTERVRITSAGLVGIGTTNPLNKLVVSHNNGAEGIEFLPGYTSNRNITFHYNRSGATYVQNDQIASAHIFRIASDSTQAAIIDSSGRLGVGTSSPGASLHVAGAITSAPTGSGLLAGINSNYGQAKLYGTTGGILDFGASGADANARLLVNNSDSALQFHTNNGSTLGVRMVLDSSGRLGIGTSSPTGQLSLQETTAPTIDFYTGATKRGIIKATAAVLDLNPLTGSDITFTCDSTERMRLTTAGRLGIGTSSPGAKLQVSDSISSTSSTVSRFFNSYNNYDANGTTSYPVLLLERTGKDGFTFGSTATFGIARYENTGSNARTRLDIQLAHGNVSTPDTNVMSLLSSGAVGIGTTSPAAPLDVNGAIYSRSSGVYTDAITAYSGSSLAINAGSSNLNITVNASERLRIDSSGRLLVGTPTARSNMGSGALTAGFQVEGLTNNNNRYVAQIYNAADVGSPVHIFAKSRGTSLGSNTIVQANDQLGDLVFEGADGTNFVRAASITALVDGTPGAADMPGRLVFSTTADGASSPTERMRIGNDGTTLWRSVGTASYHDLGNNNTSFAGDVIAFSAYRNTSNSTYNFLTCVRQGFANALHIRDSGNVVNVNNSYGAISDAKLKENIVDAGSQWNDLKSLQIRKYNFKEETGQPTHTQIGLIAQEAELVSPGLVNESPDRDSEGNDLGTVTKSVNYSVLYMKAVKALQEAMERIEQLEAKVSVLESKP